MKHEPVNDHAERKRILALIERCGKEQTMSRCTKARCPMQFGTVPDDCDLKDCIYRTESNIRFEIIVNGNCMLCGKPLRGTRLFLCEGCSEKGADDE